MNLNNFVKRLLTSLIGMSLFGTVIYYAQCPVCLPFLVLFVGALTSRSVSEFYHLYDHKKSVPLKKIGTTTAFLYVMMLVISAKYPLFYLFPWGVLVLALLSAFLYFFYHQNASFHNESLLCLPITFFPFLYLVLPLGCAISLLYYFPENVLQDGRWWLFYVVAISKMTDTGAYAVGKLCGRHLLAKWISPNKTIEGMLGGMGFALLGGFLIPYLANVLSGPHALSFSLLESFGLTLCITVLAQIGDLAESLLKRDAGVKDSSDLPGLGGILDVVDSLIFTLPLMYLYVLICYPK